MKPPDESRKSEAGIVAVDRSFSKGNNRDRAMQPYKHSEQSVPYQAGSRRLERARMTACREKPGLQYSLAETWNSLSFGHFAYGSLLQWTDKSIRKSRVSMRLVSKTPGSCHSSEAGIPFRRLPTMCDIRRTATHMSPPMQQRSET